MDTSIAEAADYLSANDFLNAYVSEFKHWHVQPSPMELQDAGFPKQVLIIPAGSQELWVGVSYWSQCGRHRFTMPALAKTLRSGQFRQLKYLSLVQPLLETAVQQAKGSYGAVPRLLNQINESRRNLEILLSVREKDFSRLFNGPLSYRHSEQALLLGERGHPAPKLRRPMTLKESLQFGPEGGSGFALGWLMVRKELIHYEASDQVDLQERILKLMASDDRLARLPEALEGYVLLPAHPWQMSLLKHIPFIVNAVGRMDIQFLPPRGKRWHPTSAMNTLYGEHAPNMLTFSLSLQSNHGAENLSPEQAARAVTACSACSSRCSSLCWQQDQAWLCLLDDEGEPVPETVMLFRDNPVQHEAGVEYNGLAALTQDHPWAERSRLHWVVSQYARNNELELAQAAEDWFMAFVESLLSAFLQDKTSTGMLASVKPHQLVLGMKDGKPLFVLIQGASLPPEDNVGMPWDAIYTVISTLAADGLADEDQLMSCLHQYLNQCQPQWSPSRERQNRKAALHASLSI